MNEPLHRQQRRAVLGVVGWSVVVVVLSFAFAYLWRLFVGPYTDFWTTRMMDHEKAQVTLASQQCADPATRAKLEGWNMCERARVTLSKPVSIGAFYDLMDWLSVCQHGICTVAGVNVTDSLYWLSKLAVFAMGVLWVASTLGIVSATHGRAVTYYQLPHYVAPPTSSSSSSVDKLVNP